MKTSQLGIMQLGIMEIPQQCPKVVELQASLLHECVVLSTWIQRRGTMACTLSTRVVFLPAKVSSLGAPLFKGGYNAGLCDWLVVLFVSVAGGTAKVLKTSLYFPVGNVTSFPRFCGLWSASLCIPLILDHSDERGATLVTYIYRFNVTIASTIHSFSRRLVNSCRHAADISGGINSCWISPRNDAPHFTNGNSVVPETFGLLIILMLTLGGKV